jgi:hypothetical protein
MKNTLILALMMTTAQFSLGREAEYLKIIKIVTAGIKVEYSTNKDIDFSCLFKDKIFMIESLIEESPIAEGDVIDEKIK